MNKVEMEPSDGLSTFPTSKKTDKHGLFYQFFIEFAWNGFCRLGRYLLKKFCGDSLIKNRDIRINEGNERLNRLDDLEDVIIDDFYVDSDNEINKGATTAKMHSLQNELKVDTSGDFGASVFMRIENENGSTEKVELENFKANKINARMISELDNVSHSTSFKFFESLLNINLIKEEKEPPSNVKTHLLFCVRQKLRPFFIMDQSWFKGRDKSFTKENIEKVENCLKTAYKESPRENSDIKSVLLYLRAIKNNRYPEIFPFHSEFITCYYKLPFFGNIRSIANHLFLGYPGGKSSTCFDVTLLRKLADYIKSTGNNPLVLEVHAGNGLLSKELNKMGVSAIATDACQSKFVCKELMQDVFFHFDADAMGNFSRIVTIIRNKNIEVSPILIANAPGGDLNRFSFFVVDAISSIEGLTAIIIGKSHLNAYLDEAVIGVDIQCTRLTSTLSYVGQGAVFDEVYEYQLKKPSMFKTPYGEPILVNHMH